MGRNNADFSWAADQARQYAETAVKEESLMGRVKTTYDDDSSEDKDYPRDMERPQS